jgi:hypothetical protein
VDGGNFADLGEGIFGFACRLDDQSIGALFHESVGWIHLGWYKDRGETRMIIHNDGSPLTLEAAESLLAIAAKIRED